MSCHGNNATPPSPAIAPGAEDLDVARFARELGHRWPGGVDPRLRALVPEFDAPFFQAGLAGYSDAAMRLVARRNGCPFCVTEALLDRMLLGGGRGFDKADLELIRDNVPGGAEDRPLAGQIIGSDPDEMAAAALKMIEQASRRDREYRDMAYGDGRLPDYVNTKWQVHEGDRMAAAESSPVAASPETSDASFATIDVNLACPVKKIDRKARGGHWLSEPQGAIEILRAVRAAVPPGILCTVKLRRGYDDTPEMATAFEQIFNACYELGYAWATVHARTVEQKYIGPSRWTFLRDLVARHPDKLIFGSGDVWDVHDIFRMIAYTGVAGVSVARGCIGNPWIFRQARELLAGVPVRVPTIAEQRSVLFDHFRLSVAVNGERAAGKMMRKFGIRFAVHHPQAEQVRQRMIAVNSTPDWLSVLATLYPVAEPETLAVAL
ncbi:MAG: tRNA-dihydrouridine synthase family protein [Phycisphaeraceae bacterium]|nr:tRNA-dihydrouridine synthase family protein [Phycisphaeraceae bacterium]